MATIWAGIDSGKRTHHCVVMDETGTVLHSKRVENDETALLELIASVVDLASGGDVVWGTDLNSGGAALLIALLAGHENPSAPADKRPTHTIVEHHRQQGRTPAPAQNRNSGRSRRTPATGHRSVDQG